MGDETRCVQELQSKARMAHAHAKTPMEKLQSALLMRGASGIKGLSRTFRIMDDSGDQKLSFDEFVTGVHDVGIKLDQNSAKELFYDFDRDGSGTISVSEFLRALQPPMNDRRRALVDQAFAKMDQTGDGVVNVKDLVKTYNAKKHPKYISGEWTETQVLEKYLSTFEAEGHQDGQVTRAEFTSYYSSLSCSIDNDAYFDLMMRSSWKL